MLLTIENTTAYCYTGSKTFNPHQPTAVFIHGAQNDHSVWALQTRYFAHHGWNVLAVDLPGHGRSGGAAKTSVEELAQAGITQGTMRLSVGLEDADDLIEDLARGLKLSQKGA